MVIVRTGNGPVIHQGMFGIESLEIVSIGFVFIDTPGNPVLEGAFRGNRLTVNHRPVRFFYLIFPLEHFVESRQRLAGPGHQDYAAGGTVNAMGESQENIAGFVIFLLQICLDGIQQRSIPCLVNHDDLPAGFVNGNDMIVFVYYFHDSMGNG